MLPKEMPTKSILKGKSVTMLDVRGILEEFARVILFRHLRRRKRIHVHKVSGSGVLLPAAGSRSVTARVYGIIVRL